MRTINRAIALFAMSVALSPAAFAAPSTAENFATCRAEAETLYGNGSEPARVRLDDVRKSGRELQLSVVTPAGETIKAVCSVNRKTGDLVALEPRPAPAANFETAVAAGN